MARVEAVLSLSIPALRQIMRHAPAQYVSPLNSAMSVYEINTGK